MLIQHKHTWGVKVGERGWKLTWLSTCLLGVPLASFVCFHVPVEIKGRIKDGAPESTCFSSTETQKASETAGPALACDVWESHWSVRMGSCVFVLSLGFYSSLSMHLIRETLVLIHTSAWFCLPPHLFWFLMSRIPNDDVWRYCDTTLKRRPP